MAELTLREALGRLDAVELARQGEMRGNDPKEAATAALDMIGVCPALDMVIKAGGTAKLAGLVDVTYAMNAVVNTLMCLVAMLEAHELEATATE